MLIIHLFLFYFYRRRLGTNTAELLTIKTLSNHLITRSRDFDSPTDSIRTPYVRVEPNIAAACCSASDGDSMVRTGALPPPVGERGAGASNSYTSNYSTTEMAESRGPVMEL
eukprot:2188313-Pyramimonas_sp.AAC.2